MTPGTAPTRPTRRSQPQQSQQPHQHLLSSYTQEILTAPIKIMNRKIRRQWSGAKAVDGSGIHIASRPRGSRHSEKASWDRDGGFFSHGPKPTLDRDVTATSRTRNQAPGQRVGGTPAQLVATKGYEAMEAHFMLSADETVGDRLYFPALMLSLVMDKPGFRTAENATRLLTGLDNAKVTPGYLAGDRLYTRQKPEKFQAIVDAYGGTLITDFRKDLLGRQGQAHGADQIEGHHYCPMMPDDLADAVKNFRNTSHPDYKNLATLKSRIKARHDYLMRNKSAPRPGGRRQMQCPASGTSPLVACELKPASQNDRMTLQPDGTVTDARLEIIIRPERMTNGETAECCSKQTFTIQPHEGAKHRQGLPYLSPEHTAVKRALRNSQEGIHGYGKDDLFEAMGRAQLRRARGLAAQTLYQAVGWAVANIRKIVGFIKSAKLDTDGRYWKPRQLTPDADGYADELDQIPDDNDPDPPPPPDE